MAICPDCKTSYEAGVVICRDCRGPLVERLDRAEAEWVELVPLRPVDNAVTAAMWRGALESQGLHPVVRSHALPAYGEVLRDWTSRSWGMLMIPEEELDEARLVLDDFLATAAERGPVTEEETDGPSG